MKSIYYILLLAITISCKQIEIKYVYPPNNELSKNTEKDEIAPISQPNYYYRDSLSFSPYLKEKIENDDTLVYPSNYWALKTLNLDIIDQKWKNYLTSDVESISFISKNRGIISFSHPLHPDFGDKVKININEQSGGTDIYEFILNPVEGFNFLNIEPLKEINTQYWESHPFIADTIINGDRVSLLLWASDGESPYSNLEYKDGKKERAGNIDIYYAFRKNQKWGEKRSLDLVNTNSNEISPFIYCLCGEVSYLYYSSNVFGDDYDLFYNEIKIDFEKEEINVIADKILLNKVEVKNDSNNVDLESLKKAVNTPYNEKFPYVKSINGELNLWYSSNMFSDSLMLNDSIRIINKGGYDIYSKKLETDSFPCLPAPLEAYYELTILNAEDSNQIIPDLSVQIQNAEQVSKSENKFKYKLKLGEDYNVTASSEYKFMGSNCNSNELGIINEFMAPEFEIVYGSLEPGKPEVISEEEVDISQFKKEVSPEINVVKEKVNGFEREFFVIKNIEFIKKDNNTAIKKITLTKNLREIESRYYNLENISDNKIVYSNKSLSNQISTKNLKKSVTIRDTAYLLPKYQEPYDITLRLFVLDECNNSRVRNPKVRLQSDEIDTIFRFNSEYIDLNLECGKEYYLSGASDFEQNIDDFSSKRVKIYGDNKGGFYSSIKTRNQPLNISEISSDLSISDTVFIPTFSSNRYTVKLELAQEKDRVINPLIKIINKTKNKELLIKKDNFSFYPNPLDSYEIYGGSDLDSKICLDNSDYILFNYQNPISKKAITDASIPSKLTSSKGFNKPEQCEILTLRDTIKIEQNLYPKPPCSIEFTEFEGYNRNVPYFQTGFWEVNTADKFSDHLNGLEEGFEISDTQIKRNRSDYIISGSDDGLFDIIKDDGYNYSIANARWIELHPNNKYWGWRYDYANSRTPERITKRKNRIEEYRDFSNKVTENLNIMAEKISNEILPAFKTIDSITPDDFGTKLLIEIIAVSDGRDVERGWYIGDETIKYTSLKYDSYFQTLVRRNINVVPPKVDESNKVVYERDNLGKSNATLSNLRAYFGFNEVYSRIQNNQILKEYLNQGMVVLPDNESYSKQDIEDNKIIFAVSGQTFDEFSIAKNKYYSRSKKSSYFDYDTTRRVEVVIRLMTYQNGKLKISDCCNQNIDFSDIYKDKNARKED